MTQAPTLRLLMALAGIGCIAVGLAFVSVALGVVAFGAFLLVAAFMRLPAARS